MGFPRMLRKSWAPVVTACAAGLWAGGTARGVIVYSNDTTATRNVTAPTDPAKLAAWNYQGTYSSFVATPIGPNHIATAQHIGGPYQFVYKGVTYNPVSVHDDPNSDLRIVRVDGTFPDFAPLYRKSEEMGRPLFVVGRGVPAAGVVTGPATPSGTEPKGFTWGNYDGVQSWGENTVTGTANAGRFLTFTFDAANRGAGSTRLTAGPSVANEAALTAFDSSGGIFVLDTDGVYKLAGVNFGVSGPFSTSANGSNEFNASLYDRGGFFQFNGTGNPYVLVPESATDQPGASFGSRISAALPFIDNVVPEPGAAAALSLAAAGLLLRRRTGAPTMKR